MHLSRADRNAAAALLGSPSDPSFYTRPEAGEEDAEGSELSPVAESNVEGLPNSQLSDFADALEEVGVRAVSTEWHVHLVREAESQQQFRRDSLAGKCQLCVQCPNGRKHSSLFAIHLLPHWLGSGQGRGADDPPQDTPMTCTGIKTAAMAIDKLTDPDPTQHCLVGAELSDWLTGEVYPDAVVFSTHPNGHLFGDKQTDLLQMPICACMKALMKIKRPLDPRNPSEQLPLHKLSTLKLTLSVKLTRGGISWEQDFISPGVIKLVSRVTDRALEDAESAPRKGGRREEDISKQEEVRAFAPVLLSSCLPVPRFPCLPVPPPTALTTLTAFTTLTALTAPTTALTAGRSPRGGRAAARKSLTTSALLPRSQEMAAAILLGRPAPSSVQLTRFPAPPTPVPAPAPAPLQLTVLTPQQELRREAHKHSELFLRAFAHHPDATLAALEALLAGPANPTPPEKRSKKRALPRPGLGELSPTDSHAAGSALGGPLAVRHEGARTRRCSAVTPGGTAVESGAGSSGDAGDAGGDAGGEARDEAREPALGTPSPGQQTASQQLFDLIDDDASQARASCIRGAGEGHHASEALVDATGATPRE